jgi:hypothetical protein
MAASLTLKIFEDRQFLKEQCKILGNTILRRWKKKTKEKREALLLDVKPQMYPHQWWDAHFSLEFVPVWKANVGKVVPDPDVTHRRPHRNVFLTPCINLEALKTDPPRLLSLLYNRVKYSPEEWSSYDNFLLSPQCRQGAFSISYHGDCIVMHGEKEGQLSPWDEEQAHSWSIVGFPRRILIY